jgi:hypothetical protein
MVLVIKRWECLIAAGGSQLKPDVSKEELEEFMARASNPEDVQAYLERLARGEVSEEEEEYEEEDEGDDVVVVVTDDEDEEDEDEEDIAGFVVRGEGEE